MTGLPRYALPKVAGQVEVVFSFDDKGEPKESRAVDVYEAREWAFDRYREEKASAEAEAREAGKFTDFYQEYAAGFLGQSPDEWPKPRAWAFWSLVLDEVERLGKPVPA